VRLRSAPELKFHWDKTLERGERINRLLSSIEIPPPEPGAIQAVEAEGEDDE
jgi:hypothetical protein